MRIVNVTPGLIPIPPNGWGAVEKIIWETHLNLKKLGHESHISYLEHMPENPDIVHIHVANLAILARDWGIPYYFTCHDHHAYLNGKQSSVYKENLEAMKGSVKSFVPAKYLVDYFEGVPQYLSHGVNTNIFTPTNTTFSEHKLLCVANNGYAHDQTIDRKGFGIAIEAARQLGLPITIAGPSNNKNYFNKYPPNYDRLTILYDLTEEELLTVYKNHTIFLHPSQLEAGHPNLTLLEALSSGLPIVGTFEPNNHLQGIKVVNISIDEVVSGIEHVMNNYASYKIAARKQAEQLDWYGRTKELESIYVNGKLPNMKKQLIHHYNNTSMLKKPPMTKFNFNCIDGMFAEILGGPDTKYNVKFIDKQTNNILFETEIGRNCWAKPSIKYYVDWRVEVTDKKTGNKHVYDLDLQGKRVYISLDSSSLGDTIAWFPYIEEFRKKHDCQVICSTFWNDFFKDTYPELTFVKPGETVHNLAAMYVVGLFYADDRFDSAKHPKNPINISLQNIASDILGLPYKEIRPNIARTEIDNSDSKLVTIAIHSTAQSKYWNNPFGWQEVVNWLKERGYTVKLMSQEEDGYMGNRNPTGVEQFPRSPINKVIEELQRSKAFIGVSSGLSWLSWAVGIPTVMISGFTEPYNEMESCIRISAPEGKCSGCWNRHKFDPGDWNWCPDHKGTLRQFECSREITSDVVIKELEKFLNNTCRTFYTRNGEEQLERLQYYSNTNDNVIHHGDAAGQYYATFILKELEHGEINLQKDDVFVDLGGNIGMSSLYAYDKKVGEIHAFEPDPDLRKIFSKNVPSAKLYPNAVSNVNKKVTLYHWPYNEVNTGPTYEVQTVTLRDIFKLVGKKINYLKVDIEGFERHLFDELTLNECAQIEKMMVEYHDLNSLDEFCTTIRKKGFEITHIVRGYQAVIYAKYVGKIS
jgi:autotransporter strand-loop-strand O-heptosyltransferase